MNAARLVNSLHLIPLFPLPNQGRRQTEGELNDTSTMKTRCQCKVIPGFLLCCNLAVVALGEEPNTTFRIHSGLKQVQITTPTRPADYDLRPALQSVHEDVLQKSEPLYQSAGYRAVADGEMVNKYLVKVNKVGERQLCGGFAFARLIGGPHVMPSRMAAQIVSELAQKVPSPVTEGIVVWFRGQEPGPATNNHYALVEKADPNLKAGGGGEIQIVTKNERQKIYRGLLHRFPEFGDDQQAFYTLDWDSIDVFKQPEEVVPMPSLPDGAPADFLGAANLRSRDRKFIAESLASIGRPGDGFQVKFTHSVSNLPRGGSWMMAFSASSKKKGAAQLDFRGTAEFNQNFNLAEARRMWDLMKQSPQFKAAARGDFEILRQDHSYLTKSNGAMGTDQRVHVKIGWWILSFTRSTSRMGMDGMTEELKELFRKNDAAEVDRVLAILLDRAQANDIGKPERPKPFQLD